jgi:PAS domain S-box-containing protein
MRLWDWDLQTGQLYWSPEVGTLLGVTPGSVRVTQAELLALVHPDDRESVVLAMRHAMEPQRTDATFEHRVLRSDGSAHWCVWAGKIIRDRDGTAIHILGTVHTTTALAEL